MKCIHMLWLDNQILKIHPPGAQFKTNTIFYILGRKLFWDWPYGATSGSHEIAIPTQPYNFCTCRGVSVTQNPSIHYGIDLMSPPKRRRVSPHRPLSLFFFKIFNSCMSPTFHFHDSYSTSRCRHITALTKIPYLYTISSAHVSDITAATSRG